MQEFTLKTGDYEGRYMEVVCRQSPNVEENTSEIQWTLTVAGGAAGAYSTGPTTLTIGQETVYTAGRKSYTTRVFPTVAGSVSGKLTVAHGEDGTAPVLPVCLTTAIYTQELLEASGQWQPDTIDRVTRIRASDAMIGSCATVVVSRCSERFSHSIFCRLGNQEGWLNPSGDLQETRAIFRESTVNFLLPESFYGEMPEVTQMDCQLICATWYGETCLGESSCRFRVEVNPETCRPRICGTMCPVDPLTLQLAGERMIPGVSTLLCQVTASAQKGAQLVSVTVGGVEVAAGQVQLPGWVLHEVPAVAVDSRGFETKIMLSCPYVPYVPLTLLAVASRPQPTADSAWLTIQGACFSGSFGLEANALTALVEFDGRQLSIPICPEGDTYQASVELTGLSYTAGYPVTVTVSDRVKSVTGQVSVHRGLPVYHWGESDFQFHVPVDLPALTIDGTPLMDYIRERL